MDTHSIASSYALEYIKHPACLFIGNEQSTQEHIVMLLQSHFCQYKEAAQACRVCIECRKVQEQQHESILWLYPAKQYAIDDLKVIFSTISFALDVEQHFFFIIQKADLLTPTCANALLKSLEEPPAGYHFILLAHHDEQILPTIKSRCLITQLHCVSMPTANALLPFFTTTSFQDPIAFIKELDTLNPSEWESMNVLDQLIEHWAGVYKKSIIATDADKQKQALGMMSHLKKAAAHPPMPGSSKLFWKNLFLQIKEL